MWFAHGAALLLAATGAYAQGNSTAPYPNSTYPNASVPYAEAGAKFGQPSPPKYPAPWASGSGDWAGAFAQAQAFVKQLTLMEKINLTTGTGWEQDMCVGQTGSIPRLGFRSICLQDSPVGVRATDYNSVFPAGVTIAATFDRGLFYQRGYDMGSEHREKGVDIQLGPVAGPLGRSPESGRNWEGFSPDPVLTGVAMAETIKGIQDAGVIACAKHFIGYEQEHFRQVSEALGFGYNITDTISSNIDDRTLHELYLWPFADAVRAGVGSIMCSYNQINNSYACSNAYLQNYILKGELGFQGFVMSDWGAHHGGVNTALAGLDMSMPGDALFGSGTSFWGSNLTLAVLNGSVPEWRIDDMATRILTSWYYVGRDNNTIPINFSSWTTDTFGWLHDLVGEGYGLVNQHVDVRGEHANDIRNMAARGTVLLKNVKNTLPLTGKEKFTAVFGEDAADSRFGPNGCSDRGCDNGTLGMAWGSGSAGFPYLVTPLTAIQNEVLRNQGIIQSVTDNWDADSQILQLARQATHAIVFVNSDSGEGYLSVDGNEGDRQNLTLWQNGENLIKNVTSQCNNTIVVLHSTGPVLVDSWVHNPNITALVWAGVPGQESGNSIADILYGRVNPAARLPFTMAATREDYGTDLLYWPNNGEKAPQSEFTEGVFIDYRALDRAAIDPVYEFGFGLSYTNFTYSNLQIAKHLVGNYTPNSGVTAPAPVLGNYSTKLSDYLFPANFSKTTAYLYPNVNTTDAVKDYGWTDYGNSDFIPKGARDGSPQPVNPAGGAPGGNPKLYDVLYTVNATITNTGGRDGEEVPQLYISLGSPTDPKVVLRGFERLSIDQGQSTTFSVDITRRDLSNWDVVSQNWVVSNYTKTVFVGPSSRNLPLSAKLY